MRRPARSTWPAPSARPPLSTCRRRPREWLSWAEASWGACARHSLHGQLAAWAHWAAAWAHWPPLPVHRTAEQSCYCVTTTIKRSRPGQQTLLKQPHPSPPAATSRCPAPAAAAPLRRRAHLTWTSPSHRARLRACTSSAAPSPLSCSGARPAAHCVSLLCAVCREQQPAPARACKQRSAQSTELFRCAAVLGS